MEAFIKRNGTKVYVKRGNESPVMAICRNAPLARLVEKEVEFQIRTQDAGTSLQDTLARALTMVDCAVGAQSARRFGSAFAWEKR